jgi:hypothetical protein
LIFHGLATSQRRLVRDNSCCGVRDGFLDVDRGHTVFRDRADELVRDECVRPTVPALHPKRLRQFFEMVRLFVSFDLDVALI